MLDESCVRLPNIKRIAIMGNKNICFIEQSVKINNKIGVVLFVFLIGWIIRKGLSMDSILTQPFIGETKNIPRILYPDDICFPQLTPEVTKTGGGLNVPKSYSGFQRRLLLCPFLRMAVSSRANLPIFSSCRSWSFLS